MINAYVTCDHCGDKLELQPDHRPGLQGAYKVPLGWEAEHSEGFTQHLCPACKRHEKPAQASEVTP